MYIFIKNTKIFPTKKQTKETGNDFVHLFSSFNRHLVNCSSCAVHSLHLAENCLGKTHKTMWRSFSNLPFLLIPRGQSISKACLPLIWNRSSSASSFPFHCRGPSLHCLFLDSAAATSLFSLLNPHPDNLCATARGIFQKCKSEYIILPPIIIRMKVCSLPWLLQPCEPPPHLVAHLPSLRQPSHAAACDCLWSYSHILLYLLGYFFFFFLTFIRNLIPNPVTQFG